jgi:hypothetical protein
LERRFNLRLQNTRGMVPEIYVAERAGNIEQLTAFFYGTVLREFSLVTPQHRTTPEGAQRKLINEFGEPQQVQDLANTAGDSEVGLPRLTGADGIARKLAGFPFRRELAWADEQNRINATIYYNAADANPQVAMISVRVTAVAWLNANQSGLTAVAPSVLNVLEQPVVPHTFP